MKKRRCHLLLYLGQKSETLGLLAARGVRLEDLPQRLMGKIADITLSWKVPGFLCAGDQTDVGCNSPDYCLPDHSVPTAAT